MYPFVLVVSYPIFLLIEGIQISTNLTSATLVSIVYNNHHKEYMFINNLEAETLMEQKAELLKGKVLYYEIGQALYTIQIKILI